MSKSVKLSDIANQLNVSTVTVSKALSDQKGVSEELRLKIKAIASELGYISPSAAKLRDDKKSYNIGVIVSQRYFDQSQSFYWLMYQELATKANAKNCFTMLEVVSEEDENASSAPKLLEGDRINGLIIIGMMKTSYLKTVSEHAKVPIVYLDFYNKECEKDAVVNDNYLGMYQLTDYLCSLGHKKIAYVGTLFATNSITDRYFGYLKALYENGIEIRQDYVINDRYIDSGSVSDYDIMLPDDMPTAFACNCDVVAVNLIKMLNERGLRVPEDISVIGFDNYAFQNENTLGLTTYAVDVKAMAQKAVKIIARKMSGDYINYGVSVIQGRVIVRESAQKL